MAQDMMHYDQLTQNALRQVIKDALAKVSETGLPGAHHFYITILTDYPGVDIDEQLAKKYPDDITIVLENQFWDLETHENHFEVTLKFGGVPKYLSAPYAAVTRFHDPSVGFALQFQPPSDTENVEPLNIPQGEPSTKSASNTDAEITELAPLAADVIDEMPEPAEEKPEETDSDEDNVVSLDSFRKK